MEQWEFTLDETGRWSWRGVDDAADRTSETTFASRTDCIADAMRHGYLDLRVADRLHHRRRNRVATGLLGVVSAYMARKPVSG